MGNGTFAAGNSYATESFTSAIPNLGDLNGDGILDLVTCGITDGSDGFVTVRLGTGGGSFGPPSSYAAESAATSNAALGDLNGDGVLDLVTSGYTDANDGYTTVRLGRGDGTFGSGTSYAAESGKAWYVSLGDLNGDGRLDLVSAGESDALDGFITVRIGVGDGSFGAAVSYAMESRSSFQLALGDLNGDGLLDVVSVGRNDANPAQMTVRLGQGNGTFGGATAYSETGMFSMFAVDLKDLNNDGHLDIATAGMRAGGAQGWANVRLGTGSGTFGNAVSYATETSSSYALRFGDLNGDGLNDLITAGYDSATNGYATVRLGAGNGTFGGAVSYVTESKGTYGLALGDLDGDGVLDIVTAGYSDANDGFATVRLGSTRSGVAPLLPFSLETISDARWAMSLMESKLSHLAVQRGTVGAFQSRVAIAVNVLQVSTENFKAAESRIRDADIADESSRLVRLSILQQAGTAILAQANQQPAVALQLLQGQ